MSKLVRVPIRIELDEARGGQQIVEFTPFDGFVKALARLALRSTHIHQHPFSGCLATRHLLAEVGTQPVRRARQGEAWRAGFLANLAQVR